MSKQNRKSGFEALGGLVYSTESGRLCPNCEAPIASCVCHDDSALLGSGRVVIGYETKGRKGKGVTLVKELAMTQAELDRCAQAIKKHCGTGGSVKAGTIEIQGDQRLKIQSYLDARGIRSVVSGPR